MIIDGRGFVPLLTEVPGFAEQLLIALSQRLRRAEAEAGAL